MQCPCGSNNSFAQCCKPYLQGKATPTAETLMRSRYTAYVKRDGAYLHRTWAQSSRPPKAQLMRLTPTNWTKLTILRTEAGNIHDNTGIVEFIATWQENDHEQSLHEISHFMREKGRWVYLNGDIQTT